MTEADWLNCEDVSALLSLVRGQDSHRNVPGLAGERKLRLLACACCYRIWPLLADARSREAVVTGERYAMGRATWQERNGAWRAASKAYSEICADWDGDWATLSDPAVPAARAAACCAVEADNQFDEETPFLADADAILSDCQKAVTLETGDSAGNEEAAAQRTLFHEVVPNPFRPQTTDVSALPAHIILLARTIYIRREFARMHELGELLERAGCADIDILSHCRGAGPHVRGCWVVDLLLGKG